MDGDWGCSPTVPLRAPWRAGLLCIVQPHGFHHCNMEEGINPSPLLCISFKLGRNNDDVIGRTVGRVDVSEMAGGRTT